MTNTNSPRTTTSNSSHLLHSSVTSALDALVDRWNNNLWNTTTAASTTASTAMNTTTNAKNSNTTTTTNNKIHAILLGTSDGISLARSFGSTTAASDRTLSDDVWTGIETTWAALPSNTTSAGHYLQQPLGMGNIRIVTAFYETVVLIHLHFSPLVSTVVGNSIYSLLLYIILYIMLLMSFSFVVIIYFIF